VSGVGLNDGRVHRRLLKLRKITCLVRDVRVFMMKMREEVLEQVDFAARTVTTEHVDSAFIFLYRTQ